MRFPVWCTVCEGPDKNKPYLVSPRHDGVYEMICDNGHKRTFSLQMSRFEMLFEIGLHAILDGYTREAVLSFAACYERFFEFFFRVVSHKMGVPQTEAKDTFKQINRSEPQLGAYALAFLFLFNKAPTLPGKIKFQGKDLQSFRNEVAHQGRIPTKDEAVAFGQEVFNLVHPVVHQLREDDKQHFFEELKRESGKPPRAGFRTMLNCGVRLSPAPSLNVQDYLSQLAETMASLYRAARPSGCAERRR